MKTKLYLGLIMVALATTVSAQLNPTAFSKHFVNQATNAASSRSITQSLGTNDATALGLSGALTLTTNGDGTVTAAIAQTPGTLNIIPGNGLATVGDGTNVSNNRFVLYDVSTPKVQFQSAGISWLIGGKVGIMTNNPQQALHVTGTVRATAFEDQNGNPITGGGGGDVKTNSNNTYTVTSTNTFAAPTILSNVTVNAQLTANATVQLASAPTASAILTLDGGRNLTPGVVGRDLSFIGGTLALSNTITADITSLSLNVSNLNWTTPDDYIAIGDANGRLTNRTPVTLIFTGPGFTVGTVGTTNYITNNAPITNYSFVSPGLATTVSGTTVTVSNTASGVASLTPWTSDIDAAQFALTNVNRVTLYAMQPVIRFRTLVTNDFSSDVTLTMRTNLFLPAAVAAFAPTGTNVLDTRDFRMALDLFTKGNPTDRAGSGRAWIDVCNTNEDGIVNATFETLRLSAFSNVVAVGSAASGSGVIRPLVLNYNGGTVVIGSTNKQAVNPSSAVLSLTGNGTLIAGNYNDGTGSFALNTSSDGSWKMSDWFTGAYVSGLQQSNGHVMAMSGRMTIWGDTVHSLAPILFLRGATTNTFDNDVRISINTNTFLAAAVATLQPATTNLDQRMSLQIFTKGTPTDNATAGVSWIDVASTNETAFTSGTSESIRIGKFSSGNGYVSIITNSLADGTARNLLLNHRGGTVVIGSTNKQAVFSGSSALIVESTGTALSLGYNDGTAALAVNPQSDGSTKFFDYAGGSALLSVTMSNGMAFFNKNAVFTNGFFVKSNAISAWPTAPRTAGDSYYGNSNGFVYVLCSGTGVTWTKTNLVASP